LEAYYSEIDTAGTWGGSALSASNPAYIWLPAGEYEMSDDWAPTEPYIRLVAMEGPDTVTFTGGKLGYTYAENQPTLHTTLHPLLWADAPPAVPMDALPVPRSEWLTYDAFDSVGTPDWYASTDSSIELIEDDGEYVSGSGAVRMTCDGSGGGTSTMRHDPGGWDVTAGGRATNGLVRFRIHSGTPGGDDDATDITYIQVALWGSGGKSAFYNVYNGTGGREWFDEWIETTLSPKSHVATYGGFDWDTDAVDHVTCYVKYTDGGEAGYAAVVDWDFIGFRAPVQRRAALIWTTDGGYTPTAELAAEASEWGVPMVHYVNDHYAQDAEDGGDFDGSYLTAAQLHQMQRGGHELGIYAYSPGSGPPDEHWESMTEYQRLAQTLRQQAWMVRNGFAAGAADIATNRTKWDPVSWRTLADNRLRTVRCAGPGSSGTWSSDGSVGVWFPESYPGRLGLSSGDYPDDLGTWTGASGAPFDEALFEAIRRCGTACILTHCSTNSGQFDNATAKPVWRNNVQMVYHLARAGLIDPIGIRSLGAKLTPHEPEWRRVRALEIDIDFDDMTDGGGASATYDASDDLPAGCVVDGVYVRIQNFDDSADSITEYDVEVGTSSDADRFWSSTAATAGPDTVVHASATHDDFTGSAKCASATTPRITLTTDGDFTDVDDGNLNVWIAYRMVE
jgi:hypothetical protein